MFLLTYRWQGLSLFQGFRYVVVLLLNNRIILLWLGLNGDGLPWHSLKAVLILTVSSLSLLGGHLNVLKQYFNFSPKFVLFGYTIFLKKMFDQILTATFFNCSTCVVTEWRPAQTTTSSAKPEHWNVNAFFTSDFYPALSFASGHCKSTFLITFSRTKVNRNGERPSSCLRPVFISNYLESAQ